MVKFREVKPEEVEQVEGRARGRHSGPILRAFMESNLYMAMLDRKGDPLLKDRPLMAIYSGLNQAIQKHKLPISMRRINGEIYLKRIDRKADGTPIPDWKEKLTYYPKRTQDIEPDEEKAVDIDDAIEDAVEDNDA